MERALRRDALRLSVAVIVVSAVLIGAHGAASAASGMTWSAADDIAGTNALSGVSCPSSNFCAAVDYAGNVYTYNGTAWSAADDIAGTNALYGVSCSSSSFCAAYSGDSKVYTWNGSTWSAADDIGLSGASCPSSSFCAVVDDLGNAYTYNGTTWSAADDITEYDLEGVSCPSSSFCVAVDDLGNAYTYNGSTWSEADDFAGGNYLWSVSCPSSSFCVAVGQDGNAYTYNGSTWSAADYIAGSNFLSSVSCPSSSFCVAVDQNGNASIGTGYDTETTTASATINPGTLAFAAAPGDVTFCGITLDGNTKTSTATEALDVGDNTGSGGGWNVTLSNTTFTDAASNTLNSSYFTAAEPNVPSCDTSGDCTQAAWSDNVSYPYGLPGGTATEVLSAAGGTGSGMGDQTVTIDWTATIPPTAYSGTYTSTWTLTLVSGP